MKSEVRNLVHECSKKSVVSIETALFSNLLIKKYIIYLTNLIKYDILYFTRKILF